MSNIMLYNMCIMTLDVIKIDVTQELIQQKITWKNNLLLQL